MRYTFTARDSTGTEIQTASIFAESYDQAYDDFFRHLTPDEKTRCTVIVGENGEFTLAKPAPTPCKHETSIFTETMDGAKFYFCRNCGKSLPAEQPAPTPNAHPASWSLVIADMAQRDVFGASKYNTRLQPHNGRDTLTDAYQEALDLAVYLRTAIFERDGK